MASAAGVEVVMSDAEVLSVHELLDDLKQVKRKLRKEHRVKVIQARAVFESRGALPTPLVIELRKIHNSYSKAIRTVHEARERARVSMAKERLRKKGVTRQDLESRREQRIAGLRDQVDDLGF